MAIALTPELQSAAAPVAPVAAPEDILAGAPQSNPAAGIPAQTIVSPIETPLSGQPEGTTGPAPGLLEQMTPPAPGSFADKLATALKTAHAVMSGLSATANIGKVPSGAGPLYGMAKTAQGMAEQKAAAQARQDKLAQQEVENKRENAKLDMEKQKFTLYTAEANARMANEQRVLHQTDQANIEKSIASGKGLVDRMKNAPVPGVALHSDISTDELRRRQMAGEFQDGSETAYPTGKTFTGKSDPKTGEPEWETSWTVMMLPKTYNLDKEDISAIKDLPQFKGENGQPDEKKIPTTMSGAQFNSLYQDAADRTTAIAARNDALVKANIMTQDDANKLEWKDMGPQWMNALANNGNNQFKAAGALMANPTFRAQHPHFLDEVQQNYGGAKAWSEEYNAWQKNEIDMVKAKAEAESKLGFLGDPTKTGNPAAFLASLSPQERAVVQEAGTGRMPITRWDYLLSRNPNFAAAVATAYPDFDGNKVQGYVGTVKDFTSGPTSRALNAGATAMIDLKRLYDNEGWSSRLLPYGKEAIALQNDVDKIATEIARANAGGTSAPGEKDVKNIRDAMMPTVGSRRTAAKEQMRLLMDKMRNYETTWTNAAPSPAYEAPMPGISAEARVASSYIENDGQYKVVAPDGTVGTFKNEQQAIQAQKMVDAAVKAQMGAK